MKFTDSKEDLAMIDKIARRATASYPGFTTLEISMDLAAVHSNGCPLNLKGLLDAETHNFTHDISGIISHINRGNGELVDGFQPRYAARQEEPTEPTEQSPLTERIERVLSALGAYDELAPIQGEISKCLVDLLHLADREGMDITDLMERTHDEYEAEVGGGSADDGKATPEEIEKAKELYGSNEISIDADARASRADDGVWVQAWVWLDQEEDDGEVSK